jgi:methanol--5-hydroxybenzimidazolylcobamide Co-methyltransferase
VTLGDGQVVPEINFTLPTMAITRETMPEVLRIYREMIKGVLDRAGELRSPSVVVEFETLPPMTENPEWGLDVVKVLLDGIANAKAKHGLSAVLRVTPNDTREMTRPPRMRDGELVDCMFQLFERSAQEGADMLSIESVGGKEVHDDALTYGEISQVVFALCILGVRDMHWLWTRISDIAEEHGSVSAGDTACGFANTAMVLAEQHMISRTFAAVVRAISAVRSLVAYECGAKGPGKDCGYENIYLKAITGFPMAMEGRTSACAHFSPVGNVASAACDTWSNESVQYVKLLSGMAPVCSMEQLVYDCRLMNRALAEGPETAQTLRRLLTDSDATLDPHAYVLTPSSAIQVAGAIVSAPTPYEAGRAAGLCAVRLLREGTSHGLKLNERETGWLDRIESDLEALPIDESKFIAAMMDEVEVSKFRPQDYDVN